jgi:hypothetical protein
MRDAAVDGHTTEGMERHMSRGGQRQAKEDRKRPKPAVIDP